MAHRTLRLRTLSWVCVLAFLLLAASHIFFGQAARGMSSIHRVGNDDAYISYRYALHLANGHGLVFNPGERVEGYTNLLLVLLAAGWLRIADPSSLYYTVALSSLAFLVGVVIVFASHARRRHGDAHGFVAALLMAFAPTIWAAPASGLESAAVLGLLVLLWLAVESMDPRPSLRQAAAVAVALDLLILLRADGFVFAVFVVGYFLLHRDWRTAAITAGATLPVLLGLLLWRFSYYGALLPNTFYVKVDGPLSQRLGHAVTQLAGLALGQGFWLHGLALLCVLAPSLRDSSRRRLPFGGVLALALLAYWLYIGGDQFGERFLLILIPLGIGAMLEIASRLPRGALPAAAAVVLLLQLRPLLYDERFDYSQSRYDGWITAGRFLASAHPGALLATDAAGKIPYFSGLRTIDMHGLADAHIARTHQTDFRNPGHDKSDLDYVLRRRPDLIVTWIGPDLDMDLDLRRSVYTAAGYRLRYLVNASLATMPRNVVDIEAIAPEEVERLVSHGYRLGILQRTFSSGG